MRARISRPLFLLAICSAFALGAPGHAEAQTAAE